MIDSQWPQNVIWSIPNRHSQLSISGCRLLFSPPPCVYSFHLSIDSLSPFLFRSILFLCSFRCWIHLRVWGRPSLSTLPTGQRLSPLWEAVPPVLLWDEWQIHQQWVDSGGERTHHSLNTSRTDRKTDISFIFERGRSWLFRNRICMTLDYLSTIFFKLQTQWGHSYSLSVLRWTSCTLWTVCTTPPTCWPPSSSFSIHPTTLESWVDTPCPIHTATQVTFLSH